MCLLTGCAWSWPERKRNGGGIDPQTLGALRVVIPVHVFYLECFEHHELGLELRQTYMEYKQKVLFLVPMWFSRRS